MMCVTMKCDNVTGVTYVLLPEDSGRSLPTTHDRSLFHSFSSLTGGSPWPRFSLADVGNNLSCMSLTPRQGQFFGYSLSFALRPLTFSSIEVNSTFCIHRNSSPDVSLLRVAFIPALESHS